MDSNKLKPCPLPSCGGEGVLVPDTLINGQVFTAVRCKRCGLIGPQFFIESKAEQLAITLWNDRND